MRPISPTLVLADPGAEAVPSTTPAGPAPLDLTGPTALRPFVVPGLVDGGRTVLAVAATAREAEDLVEALGSLVTPRLVGYYPSWETLPHERLSPRSDTVGRRLAVLRRLGHPGPAPANRPGKGWGERSGRSSSRRGWGARISERTRGRR